MNKRPFIVQGGHPDATDLLRLADGELAPPESRQIREHLEACWQCRAEYDEMQRAVGDCVAYREALATLHPPPPEPWRDIRYALERADVELGRAPLWKRAFGWLRAPLRSPFRWAPVAVAIVLAGVLILRLHDTPTVSAAVLLRRAVAAAETRQVQPRQIRVRTRARIMTRVVGAAAQPAADQPALRPVEELFRKARYDWNDPLSARAYLEWHSQLTSRQDQVLRAGSTYEIRTTTDASPLEQATLRLHAASLEAFEGSFVFGAERVDLADGGAAVIAASAGLPRTGPVHAERHAPPPYVAVTPEEELRVMAALQRLGADLGDPVEVRNTGSELVVSGVGVDARRQQEIRQALTGLPRVHLQFGEPAPAASPVREETRVQPSAQATPFQTQLEKHFGGRPAFDQFTDRALQGCDSVLARAHALRRLAERYPPTTESQLNPAGRQLLVSLRQEHAVALARLATELEHLVRPVFEGVGVPELAPRQPEAQRPWQSATESLFQTARDLERFLAAVLAGVPAGSVNERQAAGQLQQLRIEAEVYAGNTSQGR
jgi:hypothetical protein